MPILRLRGVLVFCVLALSTACATPGSDPGTASGTADAEPGGVLADGLERVLLGEGEALYLHPTQSIGGYDALMFAPVQVTFEAGTHALAKEQERIRSLVVDTARAEIEAAGLPVHDRSGPCTLISRTALLEIELRTPSGRSGSSVNYVSSWGRATIVMDLFDSKTGTRLMHFVSRRKMPGSVHGSGRDWKQIERTIGALMTDRQNAVTTVLTASDTAPAKSGCQGRIHQAFEEIRAAEQ